jgi:hypothetical protein
LFPAGHSFTRNIAPASGGLPGVLAGAAGFEPG